MELSPDKLAVRKMLVLLEEQDLLDDSFSVNKVVWRSDSLCSLGCIILGTKNDAEHM